MGEAFGHDAARRLALERIVADGGGGGEALLDVAGFEARLHLVVEVGPDAGEAVGLQFHAHLKLVGGRLARSLLAQRHHLVGNAEQRLHVVADLVRDNVGLREIARRMEAALQFLVEAQVDVDGAVERAIEGAHGRLAEPAFGARRIGKDDELGLLVGASRVLEDLLPDVLGIGEDMAHELRHLVVLGRDPRLARHAGHVLRVAALGLLGPGHVGDLDAAARQQRQRIDAQHQANDPHHDEGGDAHAAAAQGNRELHAAARPHAGGLLAAAVLDLVAFAVVVAIAHGAPPKTASPASGRGLTITHEPHGGCQACCQCGG